MNKLFLLPLGLSLLTAAPLFAAELPVMPTDSAMPNWHARTLPEALGLVFLFAAIGIAMAIIGYKLFDKFTPGDLHKEIIQNKNIAAAIVAAAVIVGVSIIIAAAMMG